MEATATPQHSNGGITNFFEGATIHNLVINGNMTKSGTENYYSSHEKEQVKNNANTEKQGKEAIMEYVGRLRPVVKEQYLENYDQIWEGILEISQVKAEIYNIGKQQDTTFNRNLLAQIIHQVCRIYVPTANNAQMAIRLEPEKGVDHPVRQKLGEMPDKPIKNAVDEYMQPFWG